MKRRHLALLCGGWAPERKISLLSGSCVYEALRAAGYAIRAYDLLPAQGSKGTQAKSLKTPPWAKALPLDRMASELLRQKTELVLPILHGPGGEDGKIQGYLEMLGFPYCGSSQLASTMAMNKDVAKEVFRRAGIPVADSILLLPGQKPKALGFPCVVKPTDQGSAIGVSIVKVQARFSAAVALARTLGERVLVEQFLPGRELTVGVLQDKALPVVEIKPQLGDFYDYESKYAEGGSAHLCPAPLAPKLAAAAAALGLAAHRALACRNYSRTDMILSPQGKLRVLETNTQPGMTPVSLLPDAARAAGYSYLELLEAMMEGA